MRSLLVLSAWTLLASHAHASVLAWTSAAPGNTDILLFEGSDPRPRILSPHPSLDYNPAFSPDGRWVVFTSERAGTPDLWATTVDGGELIQLTNWQAMEDAAAFSPDGRVLAFVSTLDGNADIWLMPFSPEGGSSQATNITQHPAGDFNPSFSPDGECLAFSSTRDAMINMHAQGMRDYTVVRNHDATDIYVMKRNGGEVRRLTRHPRWDGSPSWRPDGQGLVFYSNRSGRFTLYTMQRDGSLPTALGNAAGMSPRPTTQGRMVFAGANGSIQSCNRDGRAIRVESGATADCFAPDVHEDTGRMVCHAIRQDETQPLFGLRFRGPFLNTNGSITLAGTRVDWFAVRGMFVVTDAAAQRFFSTENMMRVVSCDRRGAGLQQVFPMLGDGEPPPDSTYSRTDRTVFGLTVSGDERWIATSYGLPFAQTMGEARDVDIWKFHPDGSDATNLSGESRANDAFPSFANDGRRLAFRTDRWGDNEIALMNADGSDVRRLTEHPANDTMPSISPDGRRVLFASDRAGDFGIYLIDVDDDGLTRGQPRMLTDVSSRNLHPCFSPDGKWFAYTSARAGLNDETPLLGGGNPQPYGEIFVQNIDSGECIRMTHNKWEDGTPFWTSGSARRAIRD